MGAVIDVSTLDRLTEVDSMAARSILLQIDKEISVTSAPPRLSRREKAHGQHHTKARAMPGLLAKLLPKR